MRPAWRRALPAWRRALSIAGPLLAGALGYVLLGTGPHANPARNVAQTGWVLPVQKPRDLTAADTLWGERAPWGAAPAAAEAEPAPVPVPVGVVAMRGRFEALFALPGEPLLRVREGDALPGGGRVIAISRSRVTWIDPAGQARQRELLTDLDPRGTAIDGS